MLVERIRGRKLQQIRSAYLRAHPLCVMCLAKGALTAATQLDHIKALVNGGTNEGANYQGLCDPCHVEKTAADLGRKHRPTIGLDGWPVDG
jgi:5-methylcytosine-specific restriction protein A